MQQFAYTSGKNATDSALIIDAMDLMYTCLLYTSDAADERSSVDLGGRRIIKKQTLFRVVEYSSQYTKK